MFYEILSNFVNSKIFQEFCNEDDVQRITSFFLKQEEENFALFNYVNELNHEIELLNTNIKEMEEKIGNKFIEQIYWVSKFDRHFL